MEVFASHLICLIFSSVVYQVVHEQIEKPVCVYRYFYSQYVLNTSAEMSCFKLMSCIAWWQHLQVGRNKHIQIIIRKIWLSICPCYNVSSSAASALFSLTHSSPVSHKFMAIGFYLPFCKKMTWPIVSQVEPWTLWVIFWKSHLKIELWDSLLKLPSLNISAHSYLLDCFIYIFSNNGNLRIRLEKSSVITRRKVTPISILGSRILWNKPFPKKSPEHYRVKR